MVHAEPDFYRTPVSGGGLGNGGLAGGLWVSGLAGRFVDAEALGSSR